MSAVELFSYADTAVRVVVLDGNPWFVLADLARVLEISDVSRLASRLEDGVRQTHPIADSLGRTQQFLSRRLTGQTNFTIEEIAEIAAILGVSVATLLGEVAA